MAEEKMKVDIAVYKNTGFDAVNIPDNPWRLDELFTPYKTYDGAYLVQHDYLGYVDLADIEVADARQTDYVKVRNRNSDGADNIACYTVDHYEYLTPHNVRFYLVCDAYNSLGGFLPEERKTSGGFYSNNQVLSCSANRMHVADDDKTYYTLPEPFSPSGKNHIDFTCLFDVDTSRYRFLETIAVPPIMYEQTEIIDGQLKIEAPKYNKYTYDGMSISFRNQQNVKVSDDYGTITTYIKNQNTNSYVTRQLRPTKYGICKPNGTYTSYDLGVRWYIQTDKNGKADYLQYLVGTDTQPKDFISEMVGLDKANCLTAYWEVPGNFISGTPELSNEGKYSPTEETKLGGINQIIGAKKDGTLTVNYTATTTNRKCQYGQGISFIVYNPVSGKSLTKQPYQVTGKESPVAEGNTYDYWISADIRPQGSPFFCWKNIEGSDATNSLPEIIDGAQWRSVPLYTNTMSGYELVKAQQDANNNIKMLGATLGLGGALIGGGVSIANNGTTNVGYLDENNQWQSQQIKGVDLATMNTMQQLAADGVNTFATYSLGTSSALPALAIAGAVVNFAVTAYQISEQNRILNMKSTAATTAISPGNSNYIRDMGYNTFYCMTAQYNADDMANFDKFLHRYGYNVGNKNVGIEVFNNRQNFNFVRVNDILIKSGQNSLAMINRVKQQLQNGVRIWHCAPSQEILSNPAMNPVYGGTNG